ncbi:MAG: class B sortase [Eubacteriales bacterium]|nr:class B sortase [Eubacteriales bacterium]
MLKKRRFMLLYNNNITMSGTRALNSDDFEFTDPPAPQTDEAHRFIKPVRDAESDPFLHSLENLVPDDIAPAPPKKRRTAAELAVAGIRSVMLFVCIGVFIASAGSIINTLYNYKRGDDIYAELAGDFYGETDIGYIKSEGDVINSPGSLKSDATPDFKTSLTLASDANMTNNTALKNTYNARFEQVKVKLNYLQVKNEDLYGWITIPNTNIDYPMVQGKDNDYYLDHAFNGEYLPAGSIFVDYHCNKSIMKNHNTVIYGHNMTNGLMFNHVTKYLDTKFFNENPYVEISTSEGIYTYEVFAIYQTDMYYSYIQTQFTSHAQFVDFAYEMKANSLYEREGMEFSDTDRIITLSTCTNGYYANRYCLQAKLIDVSN